MTATNQPRTLREIIVECLRITTDRDPVVSFYLPKGWELLEAELAAYVREREDAATKKEHDRCLLIAERGKYQCEARCNGGQLIADAIR